MFCCLLIRLFSSQFDDILGLLGDFQHSMAEIGWANLFVTRDRLDIMEFSDWYLSDPSCFLFKQLEPYSGISLLIFPLGSMVWTFGLISLVVVAFFYLLHYLVWPDHFHVGELLLFEVAITFEVSQDSLHHVTTYALR